MPEPRAEAVPPGTTHTVEGQQYPAEGLVPVDCLEGHRNWIKYEEGTYQTVRCWDCPCVFRV